MRTPPTQAYVAWMISATRLHESRPRRMSLNSLRKKVCEGAIGSAFLVRFLRAKTGQREAKEDFHGHANDFACGLGRAEPADFQGLCRSGIASAGGVESSGVRHRPRL